MKKFILLCTLICLMSLSLSGGPIIQSIQQVQRPAIRSLFSRITQSCGYWIASMARQASSIRFATTNAAKTTLITAAAAATIYGIIRVAKRFFQVPHTTIISQAERVLASAESYQPLVNICYRHDLVSAKGPLKNLSEDMLAELAGAKTVPFALCMTGIDNTIKDLKLHALQVRNSAALIGEHTTEAKEMRKRMLCIEQLMNQKSQDLPLVRDCMAYYRSYFELYDQKLHTVATYGNGTMNLVIPGGTAYPRIAYIPRLDQDLAQLRQTNVKVARHYPAQAMEVSIILENLTRQRDAVVNSYEYTQEFRLKQKSDQEELARQALLNEQRRQAEETRRHNQEQLYIKTQQLREQQKANALLALKQRREQGLLTPAQYEEENRRIEDSYSATHVVDAVGQLWRALT